jgi:hypothetical protein
MRTRSPRTPPLQRWAGLVWILLGLALAVPAYCHRPGWPPPPLFPRVTVTVTGAHP